MECGSILVLPLQPEVNVIFSTGLPAVLCILREALVDTGLLR